MITQQMPVVSAQGNLEMKNQADIQWDDDKPKANQQCDTNIQAKMTEELAKRALDLKKKELKWKLMQVSQAKNQERLKEIQTAVNYHRRKLSKARDLATRLREKYLKVVKSARLNEIQYKAAETQLSQQERFVADEKMQLTKLARDCTRTGSALFGDAYKLPSNPATQVKTKVPNQTGSYMNGESSHQIDQTDTATILDKLSPFLRNARLNANQTSAALKQPSLHTSLATAPDSSHGPVRRVKLPHNTRLSSIHNVDNGILKNLASFRLTSKFAELGLMLTDLIYSHNLSPLEYVCLPDLLGDCTDKTCRYQHKSNYQMTDLERLADLLSYRPQVAGFRPDPNLSDEENMKMCRVKLKHYAAKLISRNPNKSVEMIARILVEKIRANETDSELILRRREIPKVSHLEAPPLTHCTCEPIDVSSQSKDAGLEIDAIKVKLEPMDFD